MIKFRTIEDMEKMYYSTLGARYIQKADAPVLSTTTGVYNAVYGAKVWAQLNMADNTWRLIPKIPYDQSGWRVITARGSSTVTGGLAENATLPDTMKPTFKELSTKPKTVAHTFDVSEVQDFLSSETKDDAVADMAWMREYWAKEHAEHLNKMLWLDADTTSSVNIESIDRIVSSKSEEDALLTAGDADVYGIDRSDASNAWADAYVDHNSGTDRSLTDAMIRTMIYTTREYGADPQGQIFVTNYDTYSDILGLYADVARYNNPINTERRSVGVNGVQSAEGTDVGMSVQSLYGIPIFVDKDVPKDTKGRLYLLDISQDMGAPRLSIDVAKPTQYFEGGIKTGDPFAVNRLGTEGMYRTMAQTKCRFFKVQGKIRDLQ